MHIKRSPQIKDYRDFNECHGHASTGGMVAQDSGDFHTLQRRHHIRHPEPHGLAQLEKRDQAGHAPRVELAATDFQVAGEFLFGDQVELGAR